MKQFFLTTLLIAISLTVMNAQEYKKQLKNANKTLSKYYADPANNMDLLSEGIGMINDAFKDAEASKDAEAWNSKGQIYNEIAKSEMNLKVLNAEFKIPSPEAGLIAKEAFEKAIAVGTKKSHTKDAIAGLKENEGYINNIAITLFQAQEYNDAFKNFEATLKISEYLSSNSEDTRLKDTTLMKDQMFYTGVCAYFGDNKEKAVPYFEKLYKKGAAQPLVYEALFNLASETNIDKAMEYLDAGRKANPDDNGLLFAEINYYLKVGKLDILTEKLKAAIAKEPENVTVYTTLGNVYDQLNQKERGEGNIAKADEYFDLALDYFTQALARDSKNFDAKYSQGALYYNKAASMTGKLNELGSDYSSAGTKKYNEIKAEMDGYFNQAEPYFLEAEKLDPKDTNTMIALKEIYARNGQLDKSKEYKDKMEGVK